MINGVLVGSGTVAKPVIPRVIHISNETVNEPFCTVVGNHNHVTGMDVIVYGEWNKVTGMNSRVYGSHNKVSGMNAEVYGDDCKVSGMNARCTGIKCEVSGMHSSYIPISVDPSMYHAPPPGEEKTETRPDPPSTKRKYRVDDDDEEDCHSVFETKMGEDTVAKKGGQTCVVCFKNEAKLLATECVAISCGASSAPMLSSPATTTSQFAVLFVPKPSNTR
jgi:hypothetical protein